MIFYNCDNDSTYNRIDSCKAIAFDFNYFRDVDARFNDMLSYKVAKFSQIFDLTGGTSTIPNWRLKQLLLTSGFGAFAVYPADGKLYFLLGGMGGIQDHNLLPTKFVFANAHMPDGSTWSGEYKIGSECVLAKNDSTYTGILPILGKHSVTQVQTDLSFYIAIINSRILDIGIAGRDSESVAFEKVMEDVEHGNIRSIVDKNYLQQFKTLPFSGRADVIREYIEFMQFDRASECNELGLAANWNAKRESLTDSETLLNDDSTHPFVDDMKITWQAWIDEVNEKYADKLDNGPYKLEWASAWKINDIEQKINLENAAAASEQNAEPINANTEAGDTNEND